MHRPPPDDDLDKTQVLDDTADAAAALDPDATVVLDRDHPHGSTQSSAEQQPQPPKKPR